MKLTIIESPFAGELERNILYLKRAVLDSLDHGETPFASHGFFPQFISDEIEQERNNGINLGYRFWPHAEIIAFYMDYGLSPGMELAICYYGKFNKLSTGECSSPSMELRYIGLNP